MLSLDAELGAAKAHEERVAAFLASVPKRKRERVLAKYTVLEGRRMERMLKQERWARHAEDAWERGSSFRISARASSRSQ